GARHCLGRGGQPGTPGRWHSEGPCKRRACRQHLSLRSAHDRRSQGLHGAARYRRATGGCEMSWLDDVVYDDAGLVPAIAQDAVSGRILMFAFMNRESLALTRETGYATYWSRSRARLWKKGEESGHRQRVLSMRLDCDGDVVLLEIEQEGGIACHTGRVSRFFRELRTDRGATAC